MALSWDETFLKMAQAIALRSKDPSTQVGAILVSPDNRQIACGYNGFPNNIDDNPDVLAKTHDMGANCTSVPCGNGLNKYDLVIHAEANAILNCHERPTGWSLYCTHIPCCECAKMIIGSGIHKVVAIDEIGKSDLGYNKAKKIFDLAFIDFFTKQVF